MKHYAPKQTLVHKGGQIKNWSGECRDVIPTKIAVSNYSKSTSKSRLFEKNKITFYLNFSPINLLIILYQLTKFEAPSSYSFRVVMNTNFQSPNLQREIIRKKKITFFQFFTNYSTHHPLPADQVCSS